MEENLNNNSVAPTPTVIPDVPITSQPGQMTPEEIITYMRQNPDMVPAGFQNNESYYNMVYDNMNNDPMTLANYNQRIQRDFIGPMPETNDIANSINNTSSTSPYGPNFNATPTPYSRNDSIADNSVSSVNNTSSTSSYGPNFNATPTTYSRNDNSTSNSVSNTTSTSNTSPYGPNFNATPSIYSRNDNTSTDNSTNSFNSVIESSHSRTNYYNTIGYDNYRNYLISPKTYEIRTKLIESLEFTERTIRDPFPAEDCSCTKVKVHEIAKEIMRTESELRSEINAIIDKLETAKETSKNAISIMGEPFGTNKIEMLIEVLRELPDDIINRLENFALAPAVERCKECQDDANRYAHERAIAKCAEYNATEQAERGLSDFIVWHYYVVEV